MPAQRQPAKRSGTPERPVALRWLAHNLALSPATISVVLNGSPAADAIPQSTKDRVLDAVVRFAYRPNAFARALRRRRSLTIGVMVPEINEAASVISGIDGHLLRSGYLYFLTSHGRRPDAIDERQRLLIGRCVDALITVDTPYPRPLQVPVAAISGRAHPRGIIHVIMDHDAAARDALAHLSGLGHRNLAVIKGPSSRSDAEVRWRALQRAARAMCTPIDPGLAVHVRGVDDSPELGYRATRTLLATGARFTALLAFSDLVAVGAIQALGESGRRVSRDVSVVGYGDMQEAAFQTPALTTVRQPLAEMGRIAAEWIIRRITAPAHAPYPRTVVVEPEFVVRDSTGSAPT